MTKEEVLGKLTKEEKQVIEKLEEINKIFKENRLDLTLVVDNQRMELLKTLDKNYVINEFPYIRCDGAGGFFVTM